LELCRRVEKVVTRLPAPSVTLVLPLVAMVGWPKVPRVVLVEPVL
jgi:hypothetical protein